MRFLSVLLLTTLLAPSLAEARPRAHVRFVLPAPSVRVVLNPWAYGYRPGPRAGWVWVEGYYAQDGTWIPGYWSPAYQRPGYVWVPGHWERQRANSTWVDGRWELQGNYYVWVEGRWDKR